MRTLQTVHENRIYSLKITCGEKYPDDPPSAQFISRVNLPFVNQKDGKVDQAKLPVLANWVRNYSIENVLVEIRKYAQLLDNFLSFTLKCFKGKWHRSIIASFRSRPREPLSNHTRRESEQCCGCLDNTLGMKDAK